MAQVKEKLLIVDGYNVLGAWPDLSRGRPLADARDELIRRLHDYAGYSGQKIILVFDAWQSERLARTEEQHGSLSVVFTQKGEMADHYIERLCDEHAKRVDMGRLELRVATSDGVEQTIVMGRGAVRLSSRELIREISQHRSEGAVFAKPAFKSARSTIMERVPEEVRLQLEKLRRGEK